MKQFFYWLDNNDLIIVNRYTKEKMPKNWLLDDFLNDMEV